MFGITINNFRSFSNQSFDLSTVNILIGENSSGKSSLMKFLNFLHESQQSTSSSFRFTSELGKYGDFIYQHETVHKVDFTFELKSNYVEFFKKNFKKNKEWKTLNEELDLLEEDDQFIRINFSFDNDVLKSNDVKVTIENRHFGKLEIKRNTQKKKDLFSGKQCLIKFKDKDGEKFEFKNIGYDQFGFMSHIHSTDLSSQLNELYGGVDDQLFYEIGYLLVSQNYIFDKLDVLRYINPIESSPERSYVESDNQGFRPVKTISDVVNVLTDDTLIDETKAELLKELNEAIREYGILHEIRPIESGFGATELRVKVKADSIWSNIKDVGYGSSLQIPILFQAIVGQLLGGEILLIEQPEIHIHPFLQSKFIETLLKIGQKNTYIIETHSVDIIRKLQVMVKKKTNGLTNDDVQIFYFKRDIKDKSKISEHVINEHGKLIPSFPPGFYDSSSSLVKDLF